MKRDPQLDLIPETVAADPGHTLRYYQAKLGVRSLRTLRHEMTQLAKDGVVTFDRRQSDNACLWRPVDVDTDDAVLLENPKQVWVQVWEPIRIPPGPRSVFDTAPAAMHL